MRRVRLRHFFLLEAALVGLFFVQALRYAIGALYSHGASATAVLSTDPASLPANAPGLTRPETVQNALIFLGILLLLPLLALVLGRWRLLTSLTAIVIAVCRAAMIYQPPDPSLPFASVIVGLGLLYAALIIRQRARALPYMFLLGLALDQLFRATGDTLDPSWFANTPLLNFTLGGNPLVVTYWQIQLTLSSIVILIALVAALRPQTPEVTSVSADRSVLTFWGALGLGALLFLELSLLALPNAIAARSGADYTTFVPLVLAATVLPLVPWVRAQARSFIANFDGSVRGWIWMLLIALLVVFGTRINGVVGGAALVGAQFTASLMWWWLIRPQAEKERNLTGLWMLVAVVVFGLLAAGDFFTYEYAFVSDFSGDLASLNPIVPPLLRGFRGLGLGVMLLAILLSAMPMALTQRRIPWAEPRDTPRQSLVMLALLIALSVGAAFAARPPIVQAVRGIDSFRVATYNLHAGFSEFFDFDMDAIARTIEESGANVVLLQHVEAGRLSSFGVDQSLWLARRLNMDRRFYATNEGLQGLATLSNMPIVFHQGTPLPAIGQQTGVQHIQVTPDGVSAVALYNTSLGLLLDIRADQTIGDQEQDQQRQLDAILQLIFNRDYAGQLDRARIIVGGTFNNVPGSPLIEQMRVNGGFIDAFAGMAPDLAATLWRSNVRARFDYVWLSRNLTWLGYGVLPSNASDHRLAVVEVGLNR